MRALLVLVAHDLSQHLRDRSMVLFAVVIPLALSAVFSLAFSGVDDPQLEPVTAAVSVPEGDEAAAAVPQTLAGLAEAGIDVTVLEVTADEVTAAVTSGQAQVGITLPQGYAAALADGTGATVDVEVGEDAGLAGQVVVGVVSSTVEAMGRDATAVAAGAELGLDGQQLEALAAQLSGGGSAPDGAAAGGDGTATAPEGGAAWTVRGVAGGQLSLSAGIVAGQAGMFLFFTVGFAVLTMLTEREWGTLARVRSAPIRPWLVPLAKAVVAVLLGTASTTVLLVAGSLFLENVAFGSWPVVLVLVVAVVAAATSVMALILKLAGTAEQASLMLSVVAISLGVVGGTFFRVPDEGLLGQVLALNPVAALGRGLSITAGGGGVADLGPVLLTLVGFIAALLLLARVVPGRKDPL
ncbi:ABC transporter permease [uncultured Ornithinimicrobium sp.]|uniref:ABC transporter permease n=1 Tax=uncultured Ornithinimicrobium sp. TaxID=259307 RepID=UPI0025939633|nr:ABC transporter permease [uncultured Ornithinimicrobium sp.]